MPRYITSLSVAVVLATAGLAAAQESVYEYQSGVDSRLGDNRVVIPAQLHPELAVSPSVAAQPTHPNLITVQRGASVTRIDLYQRMDGEDGLDSNHSLVRAQRLARNLLGVTEADLAEARLEAEAHRPRTVTTVRYFTKRMVTPPTPGPHLYVGPMTDRAVVRSGGAVYLGPNEPEPLMIIPVQPIEPVTPHDDHLMAHRDD